MLRFVLRSLNSGHTSRSEVATETATSNQVVTAGLPFPFSLCRYLTRQVDSRVRVNECAEGGTDRGEAVGLRAPGVFAHRPKRRQSAMANWFANVSGASVYGWACSCSPSAVSATVRESPLVRGERGDACWSSNRRAAPTESLTWRSPFGSQRYWSILTMNCLRCCRAFVVTPDPAVAGFPMSPRTALLFESAARYKEPSVACSMWWSDSTRPYSCATGTDHSVTPHRVSDHTEQ